MTFDFNKGKLQIGNSNNNTNKKVTVNQSKYEVHNLRAIYVPISEETLKTLSGGNEIVFTAYNYEDLSKLAENLTNLEDKKTIQDIIELLITNQINIVTFNHIT